MPRRVKFAGTEPANDPTMPAESQKYADLQEQKEKLRLAKEMLAKKKANLNAVKEMMESKGSLPPKPAMGFLEGRDEGNSDSGRDSPKRPAPPAPISKATPKYSPKSSSSLKKSLKKSRKSSKSNKSNKSNKSSKSKYDKDDELFDDEDDISEASTDSTDDDGIAEDNVRGFRRLCMRLESDSKSLNELEINCNKINTLMADRLADLIPDNSQLKSIRLSAPAEPDNNLLLILLRGIAENASINTVVLTKTSISRETAQWLGSDIAECETIRKFSLDSCKFTDKGALSVLILGLQQSQTLTELHMRQVDLSAQYSSDMISASILFLGLKRLSLIDCNLSPNGLGFLFKNIEKSDKLKDLDLSLNERLGQTDCLLDLARAVRSSKIERLTLQSCSTNSQLPVKELAKRWVDCKLNEIDLSNNPISDDGAFYINVLLQRNQSIKDIRVKNCGLSTSQEKAIANGLKYNQSVYNTIGLDKNLGMALFDAPNTFEALGSQAKEFLSSYA